MLRTEVVPISHVSHLKICKYNVEVGSCPVLLYRVNDLHELAKIVEAYPSENCVSWGNDIPTQIVIVVMVDM